jgi:hypothetical protein
LYIHGVHNPEADFCAEKWQRVWVAFKNSGIGDELKGIFVGSLPDAEREGFEKFWAKAMDLVEGVQWGDLFGKQIVFAERFTGPLPVPGLVWLGQNAPESLESNRAGLLAILESLAELNEDMKVVKEEMFGVPVSSMRIEGVPISLHVLSKDNILAFVMGASMANDVAALLAKQKPHSALIHADRFRKALAEVPRPESEVVWLDLQALMAYFQRIPAFITQAAQQGHKGQPEPDDEAARVKRFLEKLLGECDIFDYAIVSSRMEGRQEINHTIARLKTDHRQKALGKVLTNMRPIQKFDQFVPVDALGFSVSSGWDLNALYAAILDMFPALGPEGEQALEAWNNAQRDMNFNIQEDILSWLSGESVEVYLQPAVATPFGSTDSVLMLKVKDPALAAKKIQQGLERANAFLTEKRQPPILVPLTISPATGVNVEGFKNVSHPVFAMMIRPTIGVTGDWLVIGTSEPAINKCLDCGAGKIKSISASERFLKEGVRPEGPVTSAKFTDLSNFGQELGGLMMMMGFMGNFIPDEPQARPVKAIFGTLGRLGPVLAEIDFFSSSSSVTTFQDGVYRSKAVLTYKPEPPPPPPPAPADEAQPAAEKTP